MNKIKIEKGWYYSAGTKFGWVKDGVTRQGVGVSKYLLQNFKELILEIEGKEYILDCERARAFINKYRSSEDHRGNSIGIVSKDVLEKI